MFDTLVWMLFILLPTTVMYTLLSQWTGRSGAWLFLIVYCGCAALVKFVFDKLQRWAYNKEKNDGVQ